jgi:diguanylate cyclase (GGDEF)-like protein
MPEVWTPASTAGDPSHMMNYSIGVGDLLKRIDRAAVTVAVGIIFVATIASSFTSGWMTLSEAARVQARLLADEAVALIHANDKRGEFELLRSLRQWPQVYSAQLLGPDNHVLARYVRDRQGAQDAQPGQTDDVIPIGIVFWQDIRNGPDVIAKIRLTVSLADLYRQTGRMVVFLFLGALAAFVVSGLLLRRLRPSLLEPMQSLSRLMVRVHAQSDYTVRARASNVVEIDALARGFNRMIETIQARDAELARLAFSDKLTGLPNRSAFLERLEREVERSTRTGRRLGLLFLDLDGFKGVNDTLGHGIGDRLLIEAAGRIREAIRSYDTAAPISATGTESDAARLGGDEFTVLIPDMREVDDAMVVARRIGEVLRRPFRIEGHELAISGSVGAAVFPDHGGDASELLRNADAAMYQCKRRGRDNSVMFATNEVEPTVAPQARIAHPRAKVEA